MEFVSVSTEESVATVKLTRGKVNPINETVIEEIRNCFESLVDDAGVKAVVITGNGRFFSFGFDIPELITHPREWLTGFLVKFADLYTYLFTYPKPLIAALNGHTIAGGCMIATACDYRIMVEGKAKIALNEITFGATLVAGALEMLKACVGHRNAETISFSGAMFTADEALKLGLVDMTTTEQGLFDAARKVALQFAASDSTAFRSIKMLLRKEISEKMKAREYASIQEFVDVWYSGNTWKQLEKIKIHQ